MAQSTQAIFEHLTNEQGLSSDKVEAVIQDQAGFYWIATQNGLNRFDGTTFKIFRHDEADSTSLTHNHCTALAESPDGDIWVATYKGISFYDLSSGKFKRIYLSHPDKNFEITNRVYNMVFDHDGNLWIAGIGLWKLNVKSGSMKLFLPDQADSTSITDGNLITQLAYDSIRNGIWLSTGRALNFYSIDENEFYHVSHNPLHWKVLEEGDGAELTIDHHHRLWFRKRQTQTLCVFDFTQNEIRDTGKKVLHGIKSIFPDPYNRIWIFYWQQPAELFNPETGRTDSTFFKKHHLHSAISEKANSLYIDRRGQYWISSGEGISIYDEKNQFYRLYHFSEDGNRKDNEPLHIKAMAQTDRDYVWIGTNLGLFKYNLVSGQYQEVKLGTQIPYITSMSREKDHLWISAYDELVCLDPVSNRILKKIRMKSGIICIQPGYHEDLWVGLWVGGLYRLSLAEGTMDYFSSNDQKENKLKSNNIICGFSDKNSFWVGYNAGAGFSKFDSEWTHYHPKEQDPLNASAGTITVIAQGDAHTLWLGTHGSGLFHFDPGQVSYAHLQQQEGLNSNYINSILSDSKHHLWISTADGMNYYNPEKNTVLPLDMGLVFSDNDFVANGARGIDGKLYFFCNQEFVEVDPLAFKPNDQFPELVISSFMVFDQEKPLSRQGELMRLTYRENFFSILFSALKTQPGKKVNYAYRLEGFDKGWNYTTNTFASYTNVPDGRYTFQLKAANDVGEWSDARLVIPIFIRPPFWRTWWFIGACILMVLFGLYTFYQYRIRHIKKIFSIRTKISRDLHDDIGASLSSIHFYTSAAEKEVGEDPAKAKLVLRQINQRSRQIIENISDIVWANQTRPFDTSSLAGRIKNYGYDLLAHHNIECKYVIDPRAEKKLSNPEARRNILLIIKEALNNIAKYSAADHAEIHVTIHGNHLVVDIRDNGQGFDLHQHKAGNGLVNMKSRTESLDGTIEIKSEPGSGTSIHCRIPLPNISEA